MNMKTPPFTSARYTTVAAGEDCQIYHIADSTGDGLMTFYQVFPGVSIVYSDFHMSSCESGFYPDCDMLCIDHCREGRIEQEVEEDIYTYFGAGDLKIDRRLHHAGHAEFPLKHFHGMSIVFQVEQAKKSIPAEMKDFPVDLSVIQHKYCDNKHPFVIPQEPGIEHIFSELYAVPVKIKKHYLKVKVFELLLYLDALELPSTNEERPYFYKTQVEKIKAIHKLLTDNLSQNYTLNELAKQFDIPLTTMKSCFKSTYGNSLFAYRRICRMNYAASLLRQERSLSIAEIAGRVGYDSPGKFSAAFKDVIGNTPLAYRKFLV